ncbi:MAG: hypothetical protein EBZ77_17970, partial [Chitinophagia bacterium]|nr:hypothetical protein [Chitinophagia bacterium]
MKKDIYDFLPSSFPTKRRKPADHYPCYCCQKDIKETPTHYIMSKDGNAAFSISEYDELLKEFSPLTFAQIIKEVEGSRFRLESFGATCWQKFLKANPTSKVVIVENYKVLI